MKRKLLVALIANLVLLFFVFVFRLAPLLLLYLFRLTYIPSFFYILMCSKVCEKEKGKQPLIIVIIVLTVVTVVSNVVISEFLNWAGRHA